MKESRITFDDYDTDIVHMEGQPPYRVAPTVLNAERLLRLPPMLEPEDDGFSIVDLLPKLNPLDLRKLMTVIDTDDALRKRYSELRERFCGIAYPGSVSWPVPKADEILDDMHIEMGPVRGVVCTIDGQRLIAAMHRSVPKLLTIEEFSLVFGQKVEEVITRAAKSSAAEIRRFAAICNSKPEQYAVSLVSDDFTVITKIVSAYSREQLEYYAKRNKQVITDIKPSSQE